MASEVYPPQKKLITTEFPHDILSFHILPRLPAKSVLRFKCVSKQWQSFLSTPMFKKMHLHHVTNDEQKHLKFIVLSRTKKRRFCTLDCEEPELGLTVIRPSPFNAVYQRMDIISSFHGLLCVGGMNNQYEYSDIILWNPVTGEYKILSKTNFQKECYMKYGEAFELYYSSYDDDYKLLCVTNGCAYIYSLKSDTWREVDCLKDFVYERQEQMLSTWLTEKLYILRLFRDGSRQSYYSVTKFDLKTEKFNKIAAPSFERRTICLSLTVQKGSIHLWVNNGNLKVDSMDARHEIELWRMSGDEKWTKVVSYWWKPFLTLSPQPLHIMKNGNWLMHLHTRPNRGCFYRLDMVKNKNHTLCSYNAETMGICPRGKYIETFVSPNQYVK